MRMWRLVSSESYFPINLFLLNSHITWGHRSKRKLNHPSIHSFTLCSYVSLFISRKPWVPLGKLSPPSAHETSPSREGIRKKWLNSNFGKIWKGGILVLLYVINTVTWTRKSHMNWRNRISKYIAPQGKWKWIHTLTQRRRTSSRLRVTFHILEKVRQSPHSQDPAKLKDRQETTKANYQTG